VYFLFSDRATGSATVAASGQRHPNLLSTRYLGVLRQACPSPGTVVALTFLKRLPPSVLSKRKESSYGSRSRLERRFSGLAH